MTDDNPPKTQTIKPGAFREETKATIEDVDDAVNVLNEASDLLGSAGDYSQARDFGEAAVLINEALSLVGVVLEFLDTQTSVVDEQD